MRRVCAFLIITVVVLTAQAYSQQKTVADLKYHQIADYNWMRVGEYVPEVTDRLIIPIGTVESHGIDPVGTDIYITKAMKYPWAPDTYFAFPIIYFHYEKDGPLTRQILMDPRRDRGSGPVETQLSVSRDGLR